MKVLIFDTETTGLPKTHESAINARDNWPHIVSISWVLLDASTNTILSKKSFIVKPDNWTIPEDSIKIHKITNKHANEFGVPLLTAIQGFLDENCHTIVAHNANFDYNVLMNAVKWDLNMNTDILEKTVLCTMKLSKGICKLPFENGRGLKSPKLTELYEFVFHRKPITEDLHNSLYDAIILTEIVQSCDLLRKAMGLPIRPDKYVTNGVRTEPSKTLVLRISNF